MNYPDKIFYQNRPSRFGGAQSHTHVNNYMYKDVESRRECNIFHVQFHGPIPHYYLPIHLRRLHENITSANTSLGTRIPLVETFY